MSSDGRTASIRARLLIRAKERGEDFNLVLNRYAVERVIYRMSVSPWANDFVLKGALLFDLWFKQPYRPTADADFLGFGPADRATLAERLSKLCETAVDDGIKYDAKSIRIDEIREGANYTGLRATMRATLGDARCAVQLDIGHGDAVFPQPVTVEIPSMLADVAAAKMRVYPRESVVSEKLEAIVTLGMANSRMKDYYDLHALMQEGAIESKNLAPAIRATFNRRKTAIPDSTPLGLSQEFVEDASRQRQWKAFTSKNNLVAPALEDVVRELAQWLVPVMKKASAVEKD